MDPSRRSGRFVNAVNADVWWINRRETARVRIIDRVPFVSANNSTRRDHFGLENFDSIRLVKAFAVIYDIF